MNKQMMALLLSYSVMQVNSMDLPGVIGTRDATAEELMWDQKSYAIAKSMKLDLKNRDNRRNIAILTFFSTYAWDKYFDTIDSPKENSLLMFTPSTSEISCGYFIDSQRVEFKEEQKIITKSFPGSKYDDQSDSILLALKNQFCTESFLLDTITKNVNAIIDPNNPDFNLYHSLTTVYLTPKGVTKVNFKAESPFYGSFSKTVVMDPGASLVFDPFPKKKSYLAQLGSSLTSSHAQLLFVMYDQESLERDLTEKIELSNEKPELLLLIRNYISTVTENQNALHKIMLYLSGKLGTKSILPTLKEYVDTMLKQHQFHTEKSQLLFIQRMISDTLSQPEQTASIDIEIIKQLTSLIKQQQDFLKGILSKETSTIIELFLLHIKK